jgi:prepilin-type N-terminal cleavage/methylation domain-containing protein
MTPRDQGFTLVELIVVTVLLGLVTSALAFAATVMMRTGPLAEERIDDARGTSSLASWLSRDLASTPGQTWQAATGGVDINTTKCVATGAGEHLVSVGWVIGTNHRAVDYYLLDDTANPSRPADEQSSDVVRVSCDVPTSGPPTNVETTRIGTPVDRIADQPPNAVDVTNLPLVTVTIERLSGDLFEITLAGRRVP